MEDRCVEQGFKVFQLVFKFKIFKGQEKCQKSLILLKSKLTVDQYEGQELRGMAKN